MIIYQLNDNMSMYNLLYPNNYALLCNCRQSGSMLQKRYIVWVLLRGDTNW